MRFVCNLKEDKLDGFDKPYSEQLGFALKPTVGKSASAEGSYQKWHREDEGVIAF